MPPSSSSSPLLTRKSTRSKRSSRSVATPTTANVAILSASEKSRARKKRQSSKHGSVKAATATATSLTATTAAIVPCCLCHCALDYSDITACMKLRMAAASAATSIAVAATAATTAPTATTTVPTPTTTTTTPPPPPSYYDPSNGLWRCTTCPRRYHSHCHFVPLLSTNGSSRSKTSNTSSSSSSSSSNQLHPQLAFQCLICVTNSNIGSHTNSNNSSSNNNQWDGDDATNDHCWGDNLFRSPPLVSSTLSIDAAGISNATSIAAAAAAAWESHPLVVSTKTREVSRHRTTVQRMVSSALTRYQRATATLETLTATARNRNHHISVVVETVPQQREQQQSDETTTVSAASAAAASPTTTTNAKDDNVVHDHSTTTTKTITKMSQELMQCIITRVTAQRTLRQLMLSLQQVQRTHMARTNWNDLIRDCNLCTTNNNNTNSIHDNKNGASNGAKSATAAHAEQNAVVRSIFPYETTEPYQRRWTPVTAEYLIDQAKRENHDIETTTDTNGVVPTEIRMSSASSLSTLKAKPSSKATTKPEKATGRTKPAHSEDDDDDNDSGISLDDLQCCVCFKGDCSDENDLLMCDGNGCYRAYHMECVYPHVSPADVSDDQDDDWFCPLCETLAESIYQIQAGTVGGEEWEECRREKARHVTNKATAGRARDAVVAAANEQDSLASWAEANDVFPDAEWAFATALQLKQGVQNTETQLLLSQILGLEAPPSSDHDQRTKEHTTIANEDVNPDDDDDNVDEDGHFDMYSYQEERRIERKERHVEEDDDDDSLSTRSSQVSLGELSRVEMNVGKDELAALTDLEESDEEEEEELITHSRPSRQSRRLRSHHTQKNGKLDHLQRQSTKGENIDPGKMDVANIVFGKRKRTDVDYHQLNEAIFGGVANGALDTLDGGEDFVFDVRNNAVFGSDDDDDVDDKEDSDSEENDDENSNDEIESE